MGKNTLEPCEAREHDGTKLTDEENDRVENRSYWDNKLDYRNRSHHHSMESHRIRQIIRRSHNRAHYLPPGIDRIFRGSNRFSRKYQTKMK
jgi:hypothetical protein